MKVYERLRGARPLIQASMVSSRTATYHIWSRMVFILRPSLPFRWDFEHRRVPLTKTVRYLQHTRGLDGIALRSYAA